jgi:hypothetical protein
MVHEPLRPRGSVMSQRAPGSEGLQSASNPKNTPSSEVQQEQPSATLDRNELARALSSGATLWIGRKCSKAINLEEIKSILRETFPFDDDYRHRTLIIPFLFCWHWFDFAGRQLCLSRRYPLTVLREFITTCFDLNYSDIEMDAVLAALIAHGFRVERLHPRDAQMFNWTTNIRSVAFVGHDGRGFAKRVPLRALGQRGALPAIKTTAGSQ